MINYLDILKGKGDSLSPRTGTAPVVPVHSPTPLTNNPLERFRRISSNMQQTANASVRQEIERIVSLPIVSKPTQEQIDTVSKYYCPDGYYKLYPEQVFALMMYHEYGGQVAPIAVGGGKTLISILIANDAYKRDGKKKILLMNPPNLIDQLRDTELPAYRKHISINVPFYWLAGETPHKRMLSAKSKRSGVYVVSYSLLSSRQGAELMDAIEPDLIIGDEIHEIASANPSARGRRFKAVVKKFSPQIVGLSGTITKKSPRDYHHLVVHALQENSFIPRPSGVSEEWAKIIDCSASSVDEYNPNTAPQPGPIKPLIDWARKNFPKEEFLDNLVGFRAAYQHRMDTCPGVVASDGEDLGVSLRISNVKITKKEKESSQGWEELQRLVKQLTDKWIAPNGDEIEHAMHIWRWRYELEGFGFYNNLFWPVPEKVAQRKSIPLNQAVDILERSIQHHVLKQEYHRVLRSWITYKAKKGLDTPFLIAGDMYRNGATNVGGELYNAWNDMRNADFEGIVEREKEIVRVCDFRVNKIVEWAKAWHKHRPEKAAIIWYKNRGVAEWLREKFQEADLPMLYCPSGKLGKSNLEDRTKGNMFAIASISSYNKGLNLQYHHDTEYYAQFPREAHIAQQSMGRVHRNEQPSDVCRIFTSICSDFDRVLFASCINDAAYIHQTTQKQKLLYADYDERPKVLPYSVLLEWGTQAKQLDKKTAEILQGTFKGE